MARGAVERGTETIFHSGDASSQKFEDELSMQGPAGSFDPAGRTSNEQYTDSQKYMSSQMYVGSQKYVENVSRQYMEYLKYMQRYMNSQRYMDTAGFTADGNVECFKRRHRTELKHGKVSMLANMGYIAPEILCFTEAEVEKEKQLYTTMDHITACSPATCLPPWAQRLQTCCATDPPAGRTELEHRKASVLASMDHIAPERTVLLPGYLSPSVGTKAADVPNQMADISRMACTVRPK